MKRLKEFLDCSMNDKNLSDLTKMCIKVLINALNNGKLLEIAGIDQNGEYYAANDNHGANAFMFCI